MKKKLLVPALLFITGLAFAQKPYFQQDVAYDIKVSLDDVKHELNAFETIIYKNNSPDELTFIYMHLWPNAYMDNHTAMGQQLKEDGSLFFYYAADSAHGYIDSLDFKVDGQSVKLEYLPGNIDIGKIILNKPLAPGGQISITTPFHVKLPSGKISRLGHIDQQYQITQWYPKPAVYDKDGWQQIPYLTQGEFYSEFGTFDVYITLPKNYVLGSTGELIDNPAEENFIDSIWKATTAITTYNAKDNAFPASSAVMKTVHYHQEHIHDFAWFCDKRYHVLKGEVTLPHTGRKVTTCVMYTNRYAGFWKDAVPYVNDALSYYSKWNGDYTYNVCTAVDGALSAGGGMEYPNITVIGSVSNALMLDIVITHEVGHNWFYGMLGSNERVHGWLDEGINSANELRYVETKYPDNALVGGTKGPNKAAEKFDLDRYKHRAQYYQLYAYCARTHIDQPIETHSKDFTSINYGSIMYMKSAIVFDYLRSYLGDSLYDHCFQVYFEKWHWKHPGPEDIRVVFETETGKNLSWFFDDLIKTDKQIDYKIVNVPRISDPENKLQDQIIVEVKNVGEVNSPVCINAMKDGKVVKSIWYDGFEGKIALMFPKGDYDQFMIDQPEVIPEVNRKNNTFYTHGLFKKVEPLKIQLAGSFDNPTRTQLFWMPTVGINKYDKFMVGAAFYNHVVPGKKFEWLVMPMYSVGAKTLVGHADAFYHIRPDKVFQDLRFGGNVSSYHYNMLHDYDLPYGYDGNVPDRKLGWLKVAPEINFDFKKAFPRSPLSHSIKLRAVYTNVEYVKHSSNGIYNDIMEVHSSERTVYEASYSFKNSRSVHPFDAMVTFQTSELMNKLMLNANYHINISAKKTIDFRLFAGTFLGTPTGGDYRFRMSGWSPNAFSNHDYLFDHVFIGRSERDGFWSHQFALEDGGFKAYTATGQSDKWLTALNVTVPMPVKNKILGSIKFYGDFGLYNTTGLLETTFMYNAGIQIMVLGKGVCDIYIPLIYSNDIKNYNTANGVSFPERIRFTLHLERYNPFTLLNNLDL
ncbi:MAG: M1 family metallopeptidase [Bacteroidota bacterium]|nr:M1 family metallopeptidase [Bacteroidota bacterium]